MYLLHLLVLLLWIIIRLCSLRNVDRILGNVKLSLSHLG